jgi:hypothetical protein
VRVETTTAGSDFKRLWFGGVWSIVVLLREEDKEDDRHRDDQPAEDERIPVHDDLLTESR